MEKAQVLIRDMIKALGDDRVGSFRGGDPEAVRAKREEKKQEMEGQQEPSEEAGDLEDAQAQQEEVDPAELEEQKQEQQEKQIKSIPSIAVGGQEVSPVDTGEDYIARDKNHEPWDEDERFQQQPWKEVGPVRRGANQWKNWSEVLGIKSPMDGNPVQQMRRYHGQGQDTPEEKNPVPINKALAPPDLMSLKPSDLTPEMAKEFLSNIQQADRVTLDHIGRIIWGISYQPDPSDSDEVVRYEIQDGLGDYIEDEEQKNSEREEKEKQVKKPTNRPSILSGGKSEGMSESEFDPDQLAEGIKIESEHTKNPVIAKEIAKDHLAEDKDYYTKLKQAGL